MPEFILLCCMTAITYIHPDKASRNIIICHKERNVYVLKKTVIFVIQ